MTSKILKYRTQKIGAPPGSLPPKGFLESLDEHEAKDIKISAFDYDKDNFVEKENATIEECLNYLKTPSITWVNITGTNDPQAVAAIGKHFDLHPLLLEDIMSLGQRSKLDNYGETIYIVGKQLFYNAELDKIEDEQVSLILGKNFLISFTESETDLFDPVKDRIRNPKSKTRQRGADYLCYSLVDCLVDSYFLVLETADERLEGLEEELLKTPTTKTLFKIQSTKREVITLRKAVWPMREVISNLRRIESPLIEDATKLYIQDVYDHTIQAIDTIESFRDVSSGMLDVYISSMSQKMNEIIKVLTVVSTIFVPLTFIASYYGMNVKMPELQYEMMYPIIIVMMIVITIWMIYFFRRKQWL